MNEELDFEQDDLDYEKDALRNAKNKESIDNVLETQKEADIDDNSEFEDNRISHDFDEVRYLDFKIPKNKKEAIALAKCAVLIDYLNNHNTIFQERDDDYKKNVSGYAAAAVASGLILVGAAVLTLTGGAALTLGGAAFGAALTGVLGAGAIIQFKEKIKNKNLAKRFFGEEAEEAKKSFTEKFERGDYSEAWNFAKQEGLDLAAPRNLVDKEVEVIRKKHKEKHKVSGFYGSKENDDYKNDKQEVKKEQNRAEFKQKEQEELENKQSTSPLLKHCQSSKLNYEVLIALLESDNNINIKNKAGDNALTAICNNSDVTPEMIELFKQKGADFAVTNASGDNPAHILSKNKHIDENVMLALIENGTNIHTLNNAGEDALLSASKSEHPNAEAVKTLVENGAKVNAKDKEGNTALDNFIKGGHYNDADLFEPIVDKDVLISKEVNDKYKPIIAAVSSENLDPAIIPVLKKAGVDINAVNENKETALLVASRANRPDLELIASLLDNGANPEMKDANGNTALDNILDNKYVVDSQVVSVLTSHNKKDGIVSKSVGEKIKEKQIESASPEFTSRKPSSGP